MTFSIIAQKLWNYCNVLRDNEMSNGLYVEQLTSVLFFKMADEGLTSAVSFRSHRFSSLCKWAIMRASEVCHG